MSFENKHFIVFLKTERSECSKLDRRIIDKTLTVKSVSGRQEGKEKSDVKPALGGDDGQCGVANYIKEVFFLLISETK